MMVHTFLHWETEQAGLYEFEARLVSIESSRTAVATWWDPVSKEKKKEEKKRTGSAEFLWIHLCCLGMEASKKSKETGYGYTSEGALHGWMYGLGAQGLTLKAQPTPPKDFYVWEVESAKDAQLWCHWKRIASKKSKAFSPKSRNCKGVTKHLPEQLQSCWPPSVLVLLSIVGDPDLESPRAQTPVLKEGGTVDLYGWGHSSQHLPQESCLTAPQGTQDTHSSWSLSPLSSLRARRNWPFWSITLLIEPRTWIGGSFLMSLG